MNDTDRPTDRAADEGVPGETTTGARAGGRKPAESPMPGGAVPDEIGTVHGAPQEADPAGDADLGSGDGEHARDVADRVRDADETLD